MPPYHMKQADDLLKWSANKLFNILDSPVFQANIYASAICKEDKNICGKSVQKSA